MTSPFRHLNYRIGIDVGEFSVGLAAIEYDDDDHAIELLSCLSHIHDGGKLSGTDKTPQSRLAVAGVQRRTRRLRRRLRARLKKLDAFLIEIGYPVGVNKPQTYDAWTARYELIQAFIDDPKIRNEKLSLAIRHIARHRGWKNPWWTYNQLRTAAIESTPTKSFVKMRENASEKYGLPQRTLSHRSLGYLGVTQAIKTVDCVNQLLKPKDQERIFFERIMEEDQYAELKSIFEIQQLPSDHSTN